MSLPQPHFNKLETGNDISTILTTNVRAIRNKMDDVQLATEPNSVGLMMRYRNLVILYGT